MSIINVRSYEPVFDTVFPKFEQVVNTKSVINWSYERKRHELSTQELMLLFLENVDFILIAQSKLSYPLPERVTVDGITRKAGSKEPLIILSLKKHDYNFSVIDERSKYGKVFIVGFGPGNPELLTIKAQRLLEGADVLLYDDLLDENYLDNFNAKKIYVGKRKGKHSVRQKDINELLYQQALQGKCVVRIKGGDPLVFGRGGEEYHYLKQRFVSVEIVPGITSALAAAADGVIPLTSRGVSTSVAFALGHDAVNNKLPKADTLVFYMGASQQKAWAVRLIDEGWPANTPVAAIRNASLIDSEIRRYTLGQLKGEQDLLPAPSLVIVGDTATADVKSLERKWLYTGSDINEFKEKGMVVHNPMISVQSLKMEDKTKEQISHLKQYDRIVFASPFAVKEFFKTLFTSGKDVRAVGHLKMSSIGNATSEELKKYGLMVKPASNSNSLTTLLQSFVDRKIYDERILLPCSNKGFANLPRELRRLGNHVFELSLYRNVLPETAVRHNLNDFYGVVFTSPTTVMNFYLLYGQLPEKLKVSLRGEYTKELFNKVFKEKCHSQ